MACPYRMGNQCEFALDKGACQGILVHYQVRLAERISLFLLRWVRDSEFAEVQVEHSYLRCHSAHGGRGGLCPPERVKGLCYREYRAGLQRDLLREAKG